MSEDLKAFVDGELSPWRRFLLTRKLSQSPELRAELAALQKLSTELSGLRSTESLPADLRARLLQAAPSMPSQSVRRPTRALALGLAGSAAAAALVAAVLIRPSLTTPGASRSESSKTMGQPVPASESVADAMSAVAPTLSKSQPEEEMAYASARSTSIQQAMKPASSGADVEDKGRVALSAIEVVVTISRVEVERRVLLAGGRRLDNASERFEVPRARLPALERELRSLGSQRTIQGMQVQKSLRVTLLPSD